MSTLTLTQCNPPFEKSWLRLCFANLHQIYLIYSNFILLAATLFYLQQRFLICSNFILFAAYPLWATVTTDTLNVFAKSRLRPETSLS